MKKTSITFGCMFLAMNAAYAGGDIEPVEPIHTGMVSEEIMEDSVHNIFVYAAGGYASLDVTTHLTAGADLKKSGPLDDKGSLYEAGLGYRFTENIFTTLSFQRTGLDFADIDNIYVSINYQLSDIILKPYIGLIAGYSTLTWNTRPHVPHAIGDEKLESTNDTYGVQVGLEHMFSEHWSLFAKYQYLKYDHVMDIDRAVTNIKHNSGQNILLGARYAF